jgi:hypothetical protein
MPLDRSPIGQYRRDRHGFNTGVVRLKLAAMPLNSDVLIAASSSCGSGNKTAGPGRHSN